MDNKLDRCWFLSKPVKVYHSGDLGDIIYSLLWCRCEFGLIDLIMGPDPRWVLRHQMDREYFEFLSPLLEAQPWINSVRFAQHPAPDMICLNDFRKTWFSGKRKSQCLFQAYPEQFGTGPLPEDFGWISAPPSHVPGLPVIVNRSSRYQSMAFPWGVVARTYHNRIGFVGLPEEHKSWGLLGKSTYIPVKNALEMASIISGSKLFIGNQSFAMSLALAMNVPTIQEVGHPNADCIFKRPNVVYYQAGPISLPSIP